MGELGNDAATAALRVSERAVSALFMLLKYLLERYDKKLDREIKEAQLSELKAQEDERTVLAKLEGKVGQIKARELLKTGEPIIGANISLNDDQMKDFARYAKKYGLLYTSFSDKTVTGEKVHTFLVREKDLHIAKAITDRMTEDLNLGKIEEAKQKIISKGEENFTKKDLRDIAYYNRKIDEIYNKSADKINKENAEIIFKDVCGEMKTKALSFDSALNRMTDRDYFHDKPYYIAERSDPEKYIELISEKDKFRDKEYTKTNYKVFSNKEQVLEMADERFEGRPRNFWDTLKTSMKERGGFSDDIVVFNTKGELSRYQELYRKTLIRTAVVEADNMEGRDYPGVINQLEKQIDKNNAVSIGDGRAADKTTNEPLILTDSATDGEKIRISESIAIAKQLEIYAAMKETYADIEADKTKLNTVTQDLKKTPETAPNYSSLISEQSALSAKIAEAEKEIKSLIDIENELKIERQQLNGIAAINALNDGIVLESENNREKTEYLEQNGNTANNRSEQFYDDEIEQINDESIFGIFDGLDDTIDRTEREERGELDRETLSMTEWRGQINEAREQIERGSPFADKSLESQNPFSKNKNKNDITYDE